MSDMNAEQLADSLEELAAEFEYREDVVEVLHLGPISQRAIQ